MSNFKKFVNFLAEKTEKPLSGEGDYKGALATNPNKNIPIKGGLGGQDYQKNPGLLVAYDDNEKEPLGNMASTGLTPQNSMPMGEKPSCCAKKVAKPKKVTNEELLRKTANMSAVEFTKYALKNLKIEGNRKIKDLSGRKFTPEPNQMIDYITNLMDTNENVMSRIVRELKRNGSFGKLVKEVLSHPEAVKELTRVFKGKYGESTQNNLNKVIREAVAQSRIADNALPNNDMQMDEEKPENQQDIPAPDMGGEDKNDADGDMHGDIVHGDKHIHHHYHNDDDDMDHDHDDEGDDSTGDDEDSSDNEDDDEDDHDHNDHDMDMDNDEDNQKSNIGENPTPNMQPQGGSSPFRKPGDLGM